MFGSGNRIAVGRVHNHDTTHRGGGDINVVDADTCSTDYSQGAGTFQYFGRNLCFTTNDQAFAIFERFNQLRLSESSSFFDSQPSCTERLQSTFTNVICNKYFHGSFVSRSVPQRGSVWLMLFFLKETMPEPSHTLPRCGTDSLTQSLASKSPVW